MDAPQYSNLRAALSAVPDPRQRRGRRYAWPLLLTLIAAALVSGQRGVRAIGQWVAEHADDLGPRSTWRRAGCRVRRPCGGRCAPSMWRPWRRSSPPSWRPCRPRRRLPAPPAPRCRGRGWARRSTAKRCGGPTGMGRAVHLVSLVRHDDGRVLGQVAVADKSNEITAAPRLLAGRDLRGTVTTMDALLTQRALAAQILAQGGHYLMVVKANQPALLAAITALFADPAAARGRRCAATRRPRATRAMAGWSSAPWSAAPR